MMMMMKHAALIQTLVISPLNYGSALLYNIPLPEKLSTVREEL